MNTDEYRALAQRLRLIVSCDGPNDADIERDCASAADAILTLLAERPAAAPPRELTRTMLDAISRVWEPHNLSDSDIRELWQVLYDGPTTAPFHVEQLEEAVVELAVPPSVAQDDELRRMYRAEAKVLELHAAIESDAALIRTLKAEVAQLNKDYHAARWDVIEAAGHLVVQVPEPGTDLARVLQTNAASRERERVAYERAAMLCDQRRPIVAVTDGEKAVHKALGVAAEAIRALAAPKHR